MYKAGFTTVAALFALAGCSSADPVAYRDLASSAYLAPNSQDDTGRVPYRYAAPANWRSYDRMIIDQVVVYRGSDHQFEDMSEEDKQTLATYMQEQFTEKLKGRFLLTNTPDPKTLRLRLTLAGAAENTPVLGTLSRFDLAGGLYNGVQSIRGREGTLTGSVIYVVEIYDAMTNRLLTASVMKQYPSPINIGASLGSLAASKTGIEKGAEALVAQLK